MAAACVARLSVISMATPSPGRFPRLVETVGDSSGATVSGESPSAEPREPSPYLAGEVVGDRYRLVREIGRGGMGVVWVAHSLVLGVDVAVKLIHASSASAALSSRMAREAHAAARLGHPALVRVFDFGWTRHGDPYLVMELVQGETLAALLKREGRVPAIRAVQMLLPIADGLRMAHDKGIVHRDIKPDNVFLAADALRRLQPKLLDFGIAKVDKQIDGRLTQMGAVLGSPDYMSPEQALGLDDLDERTDIWSLCVVLYELITGAVPFEKPNYNALMHAIINEETVPTFERGAGDKSLWEIIGRGLKKAREERFPTVTELGEALALWLYEHGIKEDLSGNSIRALWLDAAFSSGLRTDVRSVRPARDSASAPKLSSSRTPTLPTARAARQSTLPTLRPERAGSRSRALRWGLPLAALLLGAAGAILATSFAVAEPPPTTTPLALQKPLGELKPTATVTATATTATVAVPVVPVASAPRQPAAKPKLKPFAPKKAHDFGF